MWPANAALIDRPAARRSLLLPFGLLFLLFSACSSPDVDIVPGVSLELAQHRSKIISNVAYQLRFDIPLQPDEVIIGHIVVRFSLADNSRPLQLDFRESGDKIKSV